jgi:hypothetical protein
MKGQARYYFTKTVITMQTKTGNIVSKVESIRTDKDILTINFIGSH